MKSSSRHSLCGLILLSYLFSGALIEITHHDDANFLSHSKPVLETHTCGANEIHVVSDHASHCLACSHFAQRFSTEASNFSTIDATNTSFASFSSPSEQTLDADVFHSGKRGPPSSSLSL